MQDQKGVNERLSFTIEYLNDFCRFFIKTSMH